jgi:antitoxin MazE
LTICINKVYTIGMEAKIQKWGNSLGIRIPMKIIRNLSLENGATVDIEDTGDRIIIKPKQNLDDLLSCITEDNIHSETDYGISEGNEAW